MTLLTCFENWRQDSVNSLSIYQLHVFAEWSSRCYKKKKLIFVSKQKEFIVDQFSTKYHKDDLWNEKPYIQLLLPTQRKKMSRFSEEGLRRMAERNSQRANGRLRKAKQIVRKIEGWFDPLEHDEFSKFKNPLEMAEKLNELNILEKKSYIMDGKKVVEYRPRISNPKR